MLLTSFLIGFGYLFLLNPIIFTWATLPFMTAKAELLTQSPDGRERRGAPITRDVSAACNSVVFAAASDRHKNYSALRGYP